MKLWRAMAVVAALYAGSMVLRYAVAQELPGDAADAINRDKTDREEAQAGAPACSFTVIPPGPVTDQIEIELRLAIRNRTRAEPTFDVSFYWDAPEARNLISTESLAAQPGKFALARAWAGTAGRAGEQSVVFRVTDKAGNLRRGRWRIEIVPSRTRALPLLQGAWCDPACLLKGVGYPRARDVTEQDVRDAIDAMKKVGMNVVVITYVELMGPYYPSEIKELGRPLLDFDVVEAILSQADKNEMHVFLGIGRGKDPDLLWNGLQDPGRLQKAIDLGRRVAAELWERYHRHRSFYGWYFTHEMNDLAGSSAYYDPLATICHSFSPDKPVMIAPAGTPIISREALEKSRVDIFAYQDAVGPGYKDYRYTLDPEVRIADLPRVFGRYRKAHEGARKHLWADLEIWRANPETGYAPFLPAPIDEIKRQIKIESEYVEMITAYEFFSMMESPSSTLVLGGKAAVRLYREYHEYYKEVAGGQTLIRKR